MGRFCSPVPLHRPPIPRVWDRRTLCWPPETVRRHPIPDLPSPPAWFRDTASELERLSESFAAISCFPFAQSAILCVDLFSSSLVDLAPSTEHPRCPGVSRPP